MLVVGCKLGRLGTRYSNTLDALKRSADFGLDECMSVVVAADTMLSRIVYTRFGPLGLCMSLFFI